jgi:putative N6-adenine-specific DNA methylase
LFEYQKYNRYFAQAAGKLEQLCEEELRSLGAKDTRAVYRGVSFTADLETLYRINYMSRLATRVLACLISFDCHSDRYLKKTALTIPWETIMGLGDTFSISSSLSDSFFTHSLYASQFLKDVIADYFVAKCGKRPSVDVDNPDVRIHLRIERNKAAISIDTSGASLHKRGYRLSGYTAPMQETLAAAMVKMSDWEGERPLWDCMCGSGTILSEALMHYCRIPAQYLRKEFGFFRMPDFDKSKWENVKRDADSKMRPLPKGLISGSDESAKAIDVSKYNLSCLPYHSAVSLSCGPFQNAPNFEKGTIVTNPPYGVRIGTKENVAKLYKELGDFLKIKCNGTSAFVLIGDSTLRKSIGLKPSWKKPLENGSIMCELLKIDSYRVQFRDKAEKADGNDAVKTVTNKSL